MTSNHIVPDDFHPRANWSNLRLRADMLRRLREFFDSRGFLEVETPILSVDTVVDRHLDPFQVSGRWPAASGREGERGEVIGERKNPSPKPQALSPIWLQTSPEFHMKRLLAAGAGRIYQVARVFRRDELGPLHNPEFTLIEWYQPGENYVAGMQLTADLCAALMFDNALSHCGAGVPPALCSRDGRSTKGARPLVSLSYAEAFERHVGIDPHTADGMALQAAAGKLGVAAPESLSTDDRDGWLDLLLSECVQPHLGLEQTTILYDYPAGQAALARVRRDEGSPPVAERFELFIDGIELANGYHELLDADELRARNARTNALRLADGKPALPEESRLLAAMEAGLPESVGVALGFDRLVMLAAGAKSVAEVMAFPFDRA